MLLILLDTKLELVLGNLTAHKLLPAVQIYVLYTPNMPMSFKVVKQTVHLVHRFPAMRVMLVYGPKVPVFKAFVAPSTGHVPGLSLKRPVASLVLKVVGVVDYAFIHLHGVPVKDAVARGAPHLGAPGRLEDHLAALGARLGVLGEQLDRLHVARITDVVPGLDFIAVLANAVFTETAFPRSRQKPLALADRALAHKLLPRLGRLALEENLSDVPDLEEPRVPLARHLARLEHNLLDCVLPDLFQLDKLVLAHDEGLRLGEQALLALKQQVFSVPLVLAVHERLAHQRNQSRAVPQLAAAHAVRVL